MLKAPNPRELAFTAFMFVFLIASGLFYTLGARFHLVFPWMLIPGSALVVGIIVFIRARARHDATPKDPQPPQNP